MRTQTHVLFVTLYVAFVLATMGALMALTTSQTQAQTGGYSSVMHEGFCTGPVVYTFHEDMQDGGSMTGGISYNETEAKNTLAYEVDRSFYNLNGHSFNSDAERANYCIQGHVFNRCDPRKNTFGYGGCPFFYEYTLHQTAAKRQINYTDRVQGGRAHYDRSTSYPYFWRGFAAGTFIVPQNQNPNPPTLQCPASGTVGQTLNFTMTASDPDNDPIRYGISWTPDGIVDEFSAQKASGVSHTFTKSWSNAGTYTVQGWVQQVPFETSAYVGPVSCQVEITNNAQPNLVGNTPSDRSGTVGQALTLSGTVTNAGSVSTGAGFTNTLYVQFPDGTAWNSFNGSSGALGSNSTSAATTGSVTFNSVGNGQYRICADTGSVITESSDGDNCSDWANIEITAGAPPATCSVSSSPTTVTPGGTSTLTWSSSNATTAKLTWIPENVAASGSRVVNPSTTATYTIEVTGPGGSGSCNTTVSVGSAPPPPSCTITASPTNITAGNISTLTWSSSNATTVKLTWLPENVAASGSRNVSPSSTATYTVEVSGAGGISTCNDTVNVGAPPSAPSCTLTPATQTINPGAGATIGWSTTGAATSRFAWESSGTNRGASGSETFYPSETATYTFYAFNSAGVQGQCQATVTVGAPAGQPNLTAATNGAITGAPGTHNLSGTILNSSSVATPAGFNNMIWVQRMPGGDTTPYDSFIRSVSAVSAGGQASVGADVAFDVGEYRYRVCADSNTAWAGTIAESNEGDNCSGWSPITIALQAGPADLVVSGSDVSGVAGKAITLPGIVTNSGGTAAGPFHVSFEVCNLGCSWKEWVTPYIPVGSLEAGASRSVPDSYTFNVPGTFHYKICADHYGAVPESDENNNCRWYQVDVEEDTPPNQNPIGYLDSASCSAISGWTMDPDLRDQPLLVHLYVDGPAGSGSYMGQVAANEYRSDLCSAYGCNHGFTFTTPDQYKNNQSHSVYAYAINPQSGGNPLLSNSPQHFQCAPPPPACTNPSASIDATPLRVRKNAPATLTYSASGIADSCTITGPGVSESIPANSCNLSGSITTPGITTQSTYTISCPGGAPDSVTINVIPQFEEF